MKSINTIRVISEGEEEATPLTIESHERGAQLVTLRRENFVITVVGHELKRAIDNSINIREENNDINKRLYGERSEKSTNSYQ